MMLYNAPGSDLDAVEENLRMIHNRGSRNTLPFNYTGHPALAWRTGNQCPGLTGGGPGEGIPPATTATSKSCPTGHASPVRRVRRRGARQVVVAAISHDGTERFGELLGNRQRFARQT
jgi:hypothetical protein